MQGSRTGLGSSSWLEGSCAREGEEGKDGGSKLHCPIVFNGLCLCSHRQDDSRVETAGLQLAKIFLTPLLTYVQNFVRDEVLIF